MSTIKNIFSKLTAYHHFLVFLIILTVLKIINGFIVDGFDEGVHFALLGIGLIVISSLLHLVFSKLFDKNKKYLHSLISTFLIILMLSHADPEPIRGVLVILLLYVAKFFVKYKKQNIFNPVAFTIGSLTILAFFVPFLNVPPMDFTGIDIRFPIMGKSIPLLIIPIFLALIFNTKRIGKYPLAFTYILTSLALGFVLDAYSIDIFSYLIITLFVGAAVIIEPKTSPSSVKEQIIYGLFVSFIIFGLELFKMPNSIVIGILIGNISLFIYKQLKN